MERIGCIAIGYLFGMILAGDIVSHALAHESAFAIGDGNPGMANVGRVLGRKAALLTLAGDILKTVCAVFLSRIVYPQLEDLATAWAGLGATLGHVFPAWHRFKGGKGVTTISSTIILVNPLLGWLAGVVGVVTIVLSGYLSVAAVIAMAFYAVAMLFLGHPEVALIAIIFQAITVFCHWSKLIGIKDGTTHRAGLSIRFWNLFKRP